MLSAIRQARAAFSLLTPDEARERANRPVTFGLVAATDRGYEELERFLIPPEASEAVRTRLQGLVYRASSTNVPEKVDLVVYQDGIPGPKGSYRFHRNDPAATIAEILHDNDSLALSLGRQFPAFRQPVLDRIVKSVARENAFFSVATALPDVVPSLVELPWAFGEFASDTVFLTVNQARMAFLIAAACGRESGFTAQKAELAAIAAGAFGWRALARELAGKIPFGGGLIPKGAIAYAGTVLVGKGLQRVHECKAPFTRAEKREVYREAYEQGRSVAQRIAENPQGK